MKITRVFSDLEGESHFDEFEVPLHDRGAIGRLSDELPVRSIRFRLNDSGYDYDWHVAPHRQFVLLIDGGIEVETSDGETRRLKSGEILLLEDTSGRGHRTRNLEVRERRSAFVVIDENQLMPWLDNRSEKS
ncbi:hypothetical protein [Paludisphaera borealis]|uniref:Cupin 2 conserved barrel domain-containing protein n=1 Tax=Paludisphaera borealis TaxID=1387353 RepID=A0A1U7CNN3_9BACT|nr:hypothetical protein [Paludisphaera borealis]APW60519.1 hypothetical protein BSF38_01990 [Paludisphaera borealis]